MSKTTIPKEAWRDLLRHEGNRSWLKKMLESLPPDVVVKEFLRPYMRRRKGLVVALTKKRSKDLRSEDIIGNLEHILERKDDAVDPIIDVFLAVLEQFYADCDSEVAFQMTPHGFEVLAWLWSLTPDAKPIDWDLLRHVAGLSTKVDGPTAANAEQAARALKRLEHESEKARKRLEHEKGKTAELNRELEEEKQKNATLQRKFEKQRQIAGRLSSDVKSLQAELAQLREEKDAAQRTSEKAAREATAALETERAEHRATRELLAAMQGRVDELSNLNRRRESDIEALKGKIDALQKEFRLVPVEPEELAEALVIDYEALGDQPSERLIAVIDLYEAFLAGEATDLLRSYTNWDALKAAKVSGLLLLGAEVLLHDALELPIRRFMRTRGFQREARLHALTTSPTSPRLSSSEGSHG